jgi:hypothetical protein
MQCREVLHSIRLQEGKSKAHVLQLLFAARAGIINGLQNSFQVNEDSASESFQGHT